jgi:hypothetical protein
MTPDMTNHQLILFFISMTILGLAAIAGACGLGRVREEPPSDGIAGGSSSKAAEPTPPQGPGPRAATSVRVAERR